MAGERRKRKFIDRKTQISIAVEIVMHSVLLLAMISLILFAPPFVTMFSDYDVVNHQAVAKDLFTLNVHKWPLFAAIAIFIGFVSLLFSHQIVGPIHNFRGILRRLQGRDLNLRVKLRRWDYFGGLSQDINRHIELLRDDMAKLQSSQKKAEEVLAKAKENPNPEAMNELESSLKEMKSTLSQYTCD